MKDARGLNDSIIGQTFVEKELNDSDIIQTDYWKWWRENSGIDSNLGSIFVYYIILSQIIDIIFNFVWL